MKLRSQGLVWREVDGETVLLDLDSSAYLNLNRAGTCLLKLLGEERTVDDLSAALQQEFGISSEQARTDADAFVADLVRRNLLEEARA